MTTNLDILDKMADDLVNTLRRRLLGKKYSYETDGQNLGQIVLKHLLGKVIIIVDKSLANPTKTKLDEYVNLTSNSAFMRATRFRDIKFAPDMQELIEYNKKNMTICLPDISSIPKNYSSALPMKYGCQYIGMSFQKYDSNMKFYTSFFDDAGSAYVLKPEKLRYVPVKIDVPKPPPQKYSYKERSISSDYYSFKI
jgi:hypothetical protein